MKKFLAMVLCLAMALTMISCGVAGAEGYDGEVKIWVADATAEFTVSQVEAFKAAHPEYAGMTVTVESVGEGEAATNLITDVEGGADIFGFAQDQLARLVSAGALTPVTGDNLTAVTTENDAGAVAAATMGETVYAYPMTSDNGYFLYYDTSVVTDPTSLEAVIADCEKAGKRIYMEINSGWYQTSFFFGAGCTMIYEYDEDGNAIACNSDYASANGVKALKAIIALTNSPAFVNGSVADNASDYGAIVSGTWDATSVMTALGDNFAAAKLPTFTVDGETFQMGGFGGFKLLGVKPQTDAAKLGACRALAAYLTGEEVQIARYDAAKWGPSNLAAQQTEAVLADPALSALAAQLNFCTPQGQYPSEYWDRAKALGDSIIANDYDAYTDDQLLNDVLTKFQADCESYVAE